MTQSDYLLKWNMRAKWIKIEQNVEAEQLELPTTFTHAISLHFIETTTFWGFAFILHLVVRLVRSWSKKFSELGKCNYAIYLNKHKYLWLWHPFTKKINPEFVEIVFCIYQLHLTSAAIYTQTNEISSFSFAGNLRKFIWCYFCNRFASD